jgi:DNA-directed RNA polymerase subunit RPC12/RpoP
MPRLGDDIDDYCSRCKRTMDHSIVTMSGEEVQKTRCRTCGSEHSYRNNKGGKKELSAQEAFQKVLASVSQAQEAPKQKKRGKRETP